MRVTAYLSYTLFVCISTGSCYCPKAALAPLPFVLEYAIWRGWHQALIYTPDLEPGCQWATLRMVKCLSINGVATASNSLESVRMRARLGIIILAPHFTINGTGNLTKLIKKLHELEMTTTSYDWLIAARSSQDFGFINGILNASYIRFDQNIVVGYTNSKDALERKSLAVCDNNFIYKISSGSEKGRRRDRQYNENVYGVQQKTKNEYERNYYRTSERFRNITRNKTYTRNGNILSIFNSGMTDYNYSRSFDMVNTSRFSLNHRLKKLGVNSNRNSIPGIITAIQYFKVRTNSTLYAHILGYWNRGDSMSAVEPPYPVEARNFLGEELIVGRCNSTGDGNPSLDDDGPSAGPILDDILRFLTVRLNSTSVLRYYGKLGFRTYEGTWTGLLGALMDHSVDMALEPVTVHATRRQDMDFIFPIAESMCNIYIRQQETSTVRDIFLAPFSFRLVLCVVAVVLVAALAIVIISRMTSALRDTAARRMGFTEALLWSTGILCQQGGTWTPSNPAASVLLIVCLFFAVVTYNAYAAFITSVLSVRVASVDTVAAVLHSPNFKIGYIRNGADQMYLMSTKDVQLNAFYIRGYSDADNLVSSAEEGLARAARQDYAFFAGQRVARSTLKSLSQARGRCAVREVPVYSTRAHLAFPLPRYSPYAKPTLVALLQLRSSGALARLETALVPDMPQCAPAQGFASARAIDVRSALILLMVGLVSSLLLGLIEYYWKNRQRLRAQLVACYSRLGNIVMQ